MENVRTAAALRAEGWSSGEVAVQLRRAELSRVRRGAYVEGTLPGDPVARHRQLVAATLPLLAEDAVVSHGSAAVLHGLPLLEEPPARVEVTRPGARGGRDRGGVHAVAAPLDPHEVVLVDGLPVTSLARTVVVDERGREVARCDLGWAGLGVVGELDGRVKYGRLLRPGDEAEDVVWREKLRGDLIRDLGWEVVRWTWWDLDHPQALLARPDQAFRRAAARR